MTCRHPYRFFWAQKSLRKAFLKGCSTGGIFGWFMPMVLYAQGNNHDQKENSAQNTSATAKPMPPSGSPTAEAPSVPAQSFTPVPRWIKFPKLELEPVNQELAFMPWDPAQYRFHFIFILASWNPVSYETVRFINTHKSELESRRVLTVGIFVHDTQEAAKNFVRQSKPAFPVAMAAGKLLSELRQARVPTFWIVNHYGEIVLKKETDKETEQTQLMENLRAWTNF